MSWTLIPKNTAQPSFCVCVLVKSSGRMRYDVLAAWLSLGDLGKDI